MDITNDLLAAYAQGNVSDLEREAVRQYLRDNPEQLEAVMIMMDKDYDIQLDDKSNNPPLHSFNQELNTLVDNIYQEETDETTSSVDILPLLSKAAKDIVDNLCAIKCERYALKTLGIDVPVKTLEKQAKNNNWLHKDGMPLHNIGCLSGLYGSYITKKFYCSLEDISKAIKAEKVAITVIDNTELGMTPFEARRQDLDSGRNPNHAIVIKSLDQKNNTIDIVEPGISDLPQTYPLDVFYEAWNDSSNYLVTISNHSKYEPQPLDLSDVKLERELIELREAIAENAHEIWANERKKEGWTYGPKRNDEKKLHPDMIPYHLLPESEKKDYRQMAIETMKLIKKLGWELIKRK